MGTPPVWDDFRKQGVHVPIGMGEEHLKKAPPRRRLFFRTGGVSKFPFCFCHARELMKTPFYSVMKGSCKDTIFSVMQGSFRISRSFFEKSKSFLSGEFVLRFIE